MNQENRNYISSLSEFVNELMKKTEEIGGGETVWFRGVASEDFKLIPNLYRIDADKLSSQETFPEKLYFNKEIAVIEKNIDFGFSRVASAFFAKKGIPNTEWNRYALKQHYGVQTRLLDWTENALLALFFSLIDSPNSKSKNSRVWLLAPFKLNNYSIHKLYKYSIREFMNKDNVPKVDDEIPEQQKESNQQLSFKHILPFFELGDKADLVNEKGKIRLTQVFRKYYFLEYTEEQEMYPLAIHPQYLDERMAAQQSCFTLFGNKIDGLEHHGSDEHLLDYITIDAQAKSSILKELNKIGITYFSIYPDLDGLGKAIYYKNQDEIFKVLDNNNLFNNF